MALAETAGSIRSLEVRRRHDEDTARLSEALSALEVLDSRQQRGA